MKNIIKSLFTASFFFIINSNLNAEEVFTDPFRKLSYGDEVCSKKGFYHEWEQDALGNKNASYLFALDAFIIKENDYKLYFIKDTSYKDDLGNFSYKPYKFQNNQVAVELEDRFLQELKNKRTDYGKHLGKYFIFRPVIIDYGILKHVDCGMQISSCKTKTQVDKILAKDYLRIDLVGYSDCDDCECEFFNYVGSDVKLK